MQIDYIFKLSTASKIQNKRKYGWLNENFIIPMGKEREGRVADEEEGREERGS